jgi:hypothetical protein
VVLDKVRSQSKSVQVLAQEKASIAGIDAVKLDLMTAMLDKDVQVRRTVYVFTRAHKQFVVGGEAIASEYAADLPAMLEMLMSVEIAD